MNNKYTFYSPNKRIVIDFETVNYNTYNDVDVSVLEPIDIPSTDFIANDGYMLTDVIEKLMEYTKYPNAYINISSADSYNEPYLQVTYHTKETTAAFKRRVVDTQKDIFARWKAYNGKKEEAKKNKQKTIDNLRKQASKLGFDLTEKD